jgi:hypothetical protein
MEAAPQCDEALIFNTRKFLRFEAISHRFAVIMKLCAC